ncbi:hypothetical protein Poly59_24080 [Rubripirellula reticaptiva]|uniref:Bacterial extracellular solute-binding protein n=1 Tax=Rubripirellula reticaptiva TaxID=2528013 RepID=A0A5C6F6E6_9BACT|nr:hypothetical protein Poly59_24080 [Rubripirellula reticaptiva]
MHRVTRRQAISQSATCLAGITLLGCNRTDEVVAPVAAARTDIPLRITWVGSQDEADAIERGWSSVSEQAIAINVVVIDRSQSVPSIADLTELAKSSDLLSVPLMMVAELASSESIESLTGDAISVITSDLLPAMRSGVARYGGDTFAIPYAANLPALFFSTNRSEADLALSWKEYGDRVGADWNGKAGEPTTAGWAASMFLWRSIGSAQRWLVSRETFEPTIDDEPYVQALDQMRQTVARYETPRQTPSQIWQRLQQRELAAGITFPTSQANSEAELSAADLPSPESSSQSLASLAFSPWLNAITMSANCRQTDASKLFMDWISGGEGSESTRQMVAPYNAVRSSDASSSLTPYAQWIEKKLGSPVTLPSMQFISAGEYYAALDHAVMDCLDGKSTAAEALASAKSHWQSITKRVGVDVQLRAWRRANGMRA